MRKLLFLLLLLPQLVQAQPVINPTAVEFIKSPDHDVMLDTYTPAVTEYNLEIYIVGATAPMMTHPLGKPTPDENDKILVNFASSLLVWPVTTTSTYVGYITAVGPYGTGRSGPSNEFGFNNQYKCSFAVVPSSWNVLPGGGSPLVVKVSVSASGCAWTFDPLPDWLTASPLSGTTTTSVTLTALPNNTGAQRTVTLTIGTVRPATFSAVQESIPPGGTAPLPPGVPRLFVP